MTRVIIPAPRRLVTPDGGWWTGAGSMKFDGTDDYVTGVPLIPGTSLWTMICSVNMQVLPPTGQHYLMMSAGNAGAGAHTLDFVASGGLVRWWAGSGAYGWATYDQQRCPGVACWRRVGFVRRAGNVPMELWIEGTLRAVSAAFNPDVATAGMVLGSEVTHTWFAKARLHDARVYSRAWLPAEFAADMRGEWVDPTGLVRHWPLEAKVGATTHERIGNTMDAVTGAIIDPNIAPWHARAVTAPRASFPKRAAA